MHFQGALLDRVPRQSSMVELLPEMNMVMSLSSVSTARSSAGGLESKEIAGNLVVEVEVEPFKEGISIQRSPQGKVSSVGVSYVALLPTCRGMRLLVLSKVTSWQLSLLFQPLKSWGDHDSRWEFQREELA